MHWHLHLKRAALLAVLFAASGLTGVDAHAQQCGPDAPPPAVPLNDQMSGTRVLRRLVLGLTGTTPTAEQYEAMAAATTPEARDSILRSTLEAALTSPKFYERMVNFGHEWLAVGAYTTGAAGDAYQGDMSGHLFKCAANTAHPGAYYAVHEFGDSKDPARQCQDQDADGNPAVPEVHQVEPWWAPGTTVTVLGKAGSDVTQVTDSKGQPVDCGLANGGYYDPMLPPACGCGPNLVWCSPLYGLQGNSNHDFGMQRRHPYEEPARLFAHLAWHDRPLSDLILGNYSVGTNWLRALYVRFGRQMGNSALDKNTTWWRPDADNAPRDPLHPTPNDPQAWREFVVEDLEPFHLALTPDRARSGSIDRTYRFDPRTTTDAPQGLPTAGVLTMIGSLSSFPRERVRAARFLEMFACQSFSPPPADVHFPPLEVDPGTGGTCLHCHRTLDPAAISFKRWDFNPAQSFYVPWPFMPGVGRYRITKEWLSGQYPYTGTSPGYRWKNAFVPNTLLTPVTPEQVKANPEAVLLDTMPDTYTLLGEHGDGTMGPLGFGKLVVRSGEFDRCVARKMYSMFIGRDLNPATEKGFIDKLAREFVAGDRKLKPFLRYLFEQPELRRGL
ncbi:hypothetical protein D7X55_19330 [Corallococcus sp. AB049A]|uniref:DUF1549 domain-containing protein n=1 Tax=Corallococcus interemptor TaxID=2316720 RepID=A0A3A8R9U2_9BACT|nr:hypothetical protein D7Y23_06170 [Corallococcus sp. AB050B]RKH74042.1 hypothetical protein D7X96_00285 [Corallococcus interemptor]RKI63778.1 hypothetical protein D7X55_19330 [Corallococcus sp. AB049A]